jgi:flagellar biosynthetic protein FliQ
MIGRTITSADETVSGVIEEVQVYSDGLVAVLEERQEGRGRTRCVDPLMRFPPEPFGSGASLFGFRQGGTANRFCGASTSMEAKRRNGHHDGWLAKTKAGTIRPGRGTRDERSDALDIVQTAIWTVLVAAGPAVFVAMFVGVGIAFVQALTQVQEMTLTFVPKIVAILITVAFPLPLSGRKSPPSPTSSSSASKPASSQDPAGALFSVCGVSCVKRNGIKAFRFDGKLRLNRRTRLRTRMDRRHRAVHGA